MEKLKAYHKNDVTTPIYKRDYDNTVQNFT